MRTTTNLRLWLSNSDFSLQNLCMDSFEHDLFLLEKSSLFKHLVSNASLADRQILGKDFDNAMQSGQSSASDVAAIFVRPKHIRVAFYVFGGDDKYFFLDNDMVGYQDSDVYSSFYNTLPDLLHINTNYVAEDGDLWILPRAQYGHFIFDDVLPALAPYAVRYGRPPHRLRLIMSRPWQLPVLDAISNRIFGQSVPIIAYNAPSSSSLITITNGLVVLPSYWRTLFQAKRLLHEVSSKHSSVGSPSHIFLSRKGFDSESANRVLNSSALRDKLSAKGFIEIAPHNHDLHYLFSIMSRARHVVSEPGTTPLIAYLCTGANCSFSPLFSYRCMTECSKMYSYSGWRYHIPWLTMIRKILWGFPDTFNENPFSDRCWYDISAF